MHSIKTKEFSSKYLFIISLLTINKFVKNTKGNLIHLFVCTKLINTFPPEDDEHAHYKQKVTLMPEITKQLVCFCVNHYNKDKERNIHFLEENYA